MNVRKEKQLRKYSKLKKAKRSKKYKPSSLKLLKRKNGKTGLELDFEEQLKKNVVVSFSYETEKLPYLLERRYVPDYIVTKKDGTKVYLEVKGYLRPTDRSKMIAVKKMNPELDIRFCFAKDNKLKASSNTTYSMWAEKNGFPWCIGVIPKVWFKEFNA